jgi:hypothetical protein
MPEPTDVLETALRSLTVQVEFPETPPIAATVGARLRADVARTHRPPFAGTALWSRRRLVVAIALGLVLLGGAAVAARLALGTVQIQIVPTLTPSAPPEAADAFGEEVSVQEALGATGIHPGWPPAFGWPDDAYVVRSSPADRAIVLAWRDVVGSPTIPGTPWSAVLIEMRGPAEVATKYALPDSVARARVHGQAAFWIAGPHDLALQGAFGGRSVRVSGNVLIWQRSSDVTYRLETMLPKADAIALAETLGT